MGRLLRRPELWLYEVWTPLLPNGAVDISGVARSKREAIGSYHSQMGPVDHADAALSLNRYRGLLLPGAEYVEAFLCASPALMSALVKNR